MSASRKGCCKKTCKGTAKATTAAIFSALAVIGGGVYGTFKGASYVVGQCKAASDSLGDYLSLLLSSNIVIPSFGFNVSLAAIPKIIPVDTNVTLVGFGTAPIHMDIPLEFPDHLPIHIPALITSVSELLGATLEEQLKSIPQSTNSICDTVVDYAALTIGFLITLNLAWLFALTMGALVKSCTQDKEVDEIEDKLENVDLEMATPRRR